LCVMATWWCDREVIERRLVEVSKREWAYATYLATKNALEYEYTIERLFNAGRTLYRDELVGSVLEGVS
jgi:hypothetical protein